MSLECDDDSIKTLDSELSVLEDNVSNKRKNKNAFEIMKKAKIENKNKKSVGRSQTSSIWKYLEVFQDNKQR